MKLLPTVKPQRDQSIFTWLNGFKERGNFVKIEGFNQDAWRVTLSSGLRLRFDAPNRDKLSASGSGSTLEEAIRQAAKRYCESYNAWRGENSEWVEAHNARVRRRLRPRLVTKRREPV